MTKEKFYFWGVTNNEEVWKVLHEHFEKLAREDDAVVEAVATERKAVKKK